MNAYERIVLPRIIEWGLGARAITDARRAALAPAYGHVLEVGMGTGLNLSCYPGTVGRLTSIGPEPDLDPRARARADRAGLFVDHVSGVGEAMPFTDGAFDTVVVTFVLCSLPDPITAAREFARVLAPAGQLLFLEHIIGRPGFTRRAQRAFEPVLRRINCGCSLLRDTRATLEHAGFTFEHIEEEHMEEMPLLYRRVIRGIARPRGAPPG
jgi:ubiquinone/menaquinone biosynthesis C-methylase UbiE